MNIIIIYINTTTILLYFGNIYVSAENMDEAVALY